MADETERPRCGHAYLALVGVEQLLDRRTGLAARGAQGGEVDEVDGPILRPALQGGLEHILQARAAQGRNGAQGVVTHFPRAFLRRA